MTDDDFYIMDLPKYFECAWSGAIILVAFPLLLIVIVVVFPFFFIGKLADTIYHTLPKRKKEADDESK